MSNEHLVSILINNYNYGCFLAEAIDSALAQTYENFEVIVVDDGSTDNSREIIESYGNKIVPVLKENGGQASAFNTGFAASRGSIICFLDSDDVFLPEKATEIVKAFTNYPDCSWCFHPLHYTNDPLGDSVDKNGSVFLKNYDLRSFFESGNLTKEIFSILPATSGLCFTRSFLESILPMPEGKGISINENYIKYIALAISEGLTTNQKLGCLRLHNENAFTGKKNSYLTAMLIAINAYWIRVKFPLLSKYTNKEFAYGIGKLWRYLDNDSKQKDLIYVDYKKVVDNYFLLTTSLEKKQIRLKAFLHFLKG